MTDPTTSYRTIPLTQSQVAIVDAADYEWIMQWKWFAKFSRISPNAYATRKVTRRHQVWMHRVILGLEWDDPREGDHINHATLDNRRCNLRVATHAENGRNLRRRRTNTSGYPNVVWSATDSRWRVQIKRDGKLNYFGSYTSVEEAGRIAKAARASLFGEFACQGESR
jgi:hypothetical protein